MSNDSSSPHEQAAAHKAILAAKAKPAPARSAGPMNIVTTVVSGLGLYLVPPTIAVVVLLSVAASGFGSTETAMAWITENVAGQFWYMVLSDAIMLALLAGLMVVTRETWRSIGVAVRPRASTYGYILSGFLIYYASFFVVAVLLKQVLPLDFEQRQEIGFDTDIAGFSLVIAAISLVVLPPLVEEIIFRGYLYTRLRRSVSVVVSAVLISVLFAVAHLQFGSNNPLLWVAALDTFVLSMVLVWLREKTGSIWAGVGVHALKNGVAFVLLFILQL